MSTPGDAQARPRARPFRFSRVFRVRKRRVFLAARHHGQRHFSRPFVFQLLPNGLPHVRLGITVSRKAVRQAVDRNRIKRVLREGFRAVRERLPAGFDIIAVARGHAIDTTASEVAQVLDVLVRRTAGWAAKPAGGTTP